MPSHGNPLLDLVTTGTRRQRAIGGLGYETNGLSLWQVPIVELVRAVVALSFGKPNRCWSGRRFRGISALSSAPNDPADPGHSRE